MYTLPGDSQKWEFEPQWTWHCTQSQQSQCYHEQWLSIEDISICPQKIYPGSCSGLDNWPSRQTRLGCWPQWYGLGSDCLGWVMFWTLHKKQLLVKHHLRSLVIWAGSLVTRVQLLIIVGRLRSMPIFIYIILDCSFWNCDINHKSMSYIWISSACHEISYSRPCIK